MQALINGILIGGIYGVVSMGLSLVFGVLRIINFAHGELVMLGMFGTYLISVLWGVDPFLSIFFVAPVMFFLGMLIQKLFLQSLISEDDIPQLLMTLGLSLLLQNGVMILFGPDSKSLQTNYGSNFVDIGAIFVNQAQLFAFLISAIVSIVFAWIIWKTDVGKSLRAMVNDREMAELIGINTGRLYIVAFGIGTFLASIGGSVLMTYYPVYPTVGHDFLIIAFVAVVLGGMGNVLGAFVSGVIIGVIQQVTAAYWAIAMQDILVFVIFILLLLFRPNGIFGGKEGTYV